MESFQAFGEEFGIVWNTGVFGVSVGEVVTALLIFLLFLAIRRVFFRLIVTSLKGLTRRTKTDIDDQLLDAIEKPLELGFVIVGLYVGGQVLPLSPDAENIFEKLIRSFIALTLFWGIFRAIDPLSSLMDRGIEMMGSLSMRDTMKGFFVKLAKFIVVALGIAAVFQEWGFNVAAVLGSLGLVGMAVALGAKDFIANLFAGLTIFLDRMFEKGNWIQTPDVDGTVEDIGFRATKIRRFDKALVTIPNARLAGEALINFSRMTNRRIYWKIGVEYRTTKEQLHHIIQDILAYVKSCEDFETNPERTKTFVFMDSFGASSIDIMLYCFTVTTEWGEWLACKERLAYKVKDIVEGHGAAFAFPSTSLYVETLPFGTPEPFPIPAQPASPRSSAS
ncbi:mechanosensitive ion channel family protein [Candidatus Nitronereus thalassa]|uniref:Mechanosensitive ion channel family protein n=1 Tax=Candidatus Nitronereus thalassa TaxID=3020898 RepID=A0ABU3K810_9BACT|nr:mechanosensitive ion channel family protein [Candidatus Nitronereus thalassa]MDT7042497.1 mechanosensitive ion channel family protein [Candidatus Nitronereus thalassa]